MKKRIHTLDYLRGMAAFSIMVYHYMTWTFGVFGADTFLGRIGLYGVSIFYILSGLTLCLVYQNRLEPNATSIKAFFIKRAFRIMPLLWLAILLTYATNLQIPRPTKELFLNVTGLFFIDCNISIARGGWSIGNEIAFYLFFPAYLLAYKYSRALFWLLSAVVLAFFLWFAFYYIQGSIEGEWYKYINPLNQILLFASGVFMGYAYKQATYNNRALLLLLISSMLLFAFIPVTGNRVELVTGMNRIIFSALVFVICLCFFKASYTLPRQLHQPLKFLGEASYSVYLLHPIVWAGMERVLNKLHLDLFPALKVGLYMAVTLGAAYVVYTFYEMYFINMGKRVVKAKEAEASLL